MSMSTGIAGHQHAFEELCDLDDLVRQARHATPACRISARRSWKPAQLRRIDAAVWLEHVDRRMRAEIFPWCQTNTAGVMAYGSLAYGLLSGTFHAGMTFDENDWRANRGTLGSLNLFRTMFGPDHFPRNLAAVEELKTIAARHGKTLPQLALCWTTSNPAIATGLVGFRRPEEVEENLGALGWQLSPTEMAEIDAVFARHGAVTEPDGWLEDDRPAARA
jgi:aryl-alcohol dehydrogenase-like predicted oxidoreductase